MVVLVMGVAGVGKSSVAGALAEALGWPFIEGDDFHPPPNVQKMRGGAPLTEADREPWLRALGQRIRECTAERGHVVVACSALKARHRERLLPDGADARLVFLTAPAGLIRERIGQRREHFMPARLLDDQLDALEPPARAITLDARRPVHELVAAIQREIVVDRGGRP